MGRSIEDYQKKLSELENLEFLDLWRNELITFQIQLRI